MSTSRFYEEQDMPEDRPQQICCWAHFTYDGHVCAECGAECKDCDRGQQKACRRNEE